MEEKNIKKIPIFHRSLARNKISHFIDFFQDLEVSTWKKILNKIHTEKINSLKKIKIKTPEIIIPWPKVALEWWYFTGHLASKKSDFGFEFCFFKFHPQCLRFGFIPLSFIRSKPYLVLHSSITDKNKNKFYFGQNTGLINKDQIDYSKLNLKLDKASLKFDKKFFIKNKQMDLKLTPLKKFVKHYKTGYKLMYEHPKHKTYYVTIPRLKVKGKIKAGEKNYPVDGEAWFDHQKCNLPQKTSLIGWDWFSILFDDNTELMFFILRNKRGIVKNKMGGSFITKDSKVINLLQKEVKLKHLDVWKSPKTGITYPSKWEMKIPKLDLDIKISPCIKNQEVNCLKTNPSSYWEGACNVKGFKGKKKITGKSYTELVGYDTRIIAEIIKKSIS